MRTLSSLTWFNRVGLVLLLVGIPYLLAHRELLAAAAWTVALVYLAISVHRSVTARAGDRERVAAAQPYDERDAVAMTRAFAVVGQVAVLAQIAIVIWHMGRPDDVTALLLEAAKLVLLAGVLGLANRVSLQRV